MTDLFRKEALSYKKQRLLGEVLLTQPVQDKIFLISILIICILLLTFLAAGEYARKETVLGFVTTDKGVVKVYPSGKGTLSELLIDDGQHVSKGQVLARIHTGKGNALGSDIAELLVIQLMNQKQAIASRLEKEQLLLKTEMLNFRQLTKQLEKEKGILESRISDLYKRQELAKQQLNKLRSLSKDGFAAGVQIERQTDLLLTLNSEAKIAEQQLVANDTRRLEFSSTLSKLPLEFASIESELNNQMAAVEQRLLEVRASNLYSLTSAADGIVTNIQSTVGQLVSTSIPVLTIIPDDSEFIVELFVPSRAMGFVKPSMEVMIRYDAYPFQRFGLHEGTVVKVANNIYLPGELPVPVPLSEPVYKVKVALQNQSVEAYGKKLLLQNGMLLEADIVLETRGLLHWLLDPLYSLKGRV